MQESPRRPAIERSIFPGFDWSYGPPVARAEQIHNALMQDRIGRFAKAQEETAIYGHILPGQRAQRLDCGYARDTLCIAQRLRIRLQERLEIGRVGPLLQPAQCRGPYARILVRELLDEQRVE